MRADRDPLVAEIKRHNPTKLLVHLRDGETRVVPISGKKNRWEKLLGTLESLAWDAIECQDREGNLLGMVDNEEAHAEDHSDEIDRESKRDQRQLQLLKEAMSFGIQQTRAQYEGQMQQFRELASSVVQTVRVVQDSYGQAMRVQAAAQAAQAVGGGEGVGDAELLKVLGMMMMNKGPSAPRMPPKPAQPRPAQAAPTNGVHEKATAS